MPENGLRLLALDGGGVRGLSMLQILKQLMATIDPDYPPKPCDYFDMIGGTSTGGLIAIMLGRLQMTVDDCIDAYSSLSERVFQKRRHRVSIRGRPQGRFDSDELARAIREIVVQQGLAENALLKDTKDAKCKVFVCATSQTTGDTVTLTSYLSPRGHAQLLDTTKIWEAGRATSAAPSFFDPVAIGDFNQHLLDGATGANNPIYQLWNEAGDMWPEGSFEDRVQCIVSLGTGVPSLKPFKNELISIGKSIIAIATETEKTAEMFCRDKRTLDDSGRYYRFNVYPGLENIGLEDAKQKEAIVTATARYIASQAVYKQFKACAKNIGERNSLKNSIILDVGLCRVSFTFDGVPDMNEFIHRPFEMEDLEKNLLPAPQRKGRNVVVLHGLGGIGKTQLSVAFIRKYHRRFGAVFWLDGGSRDKIEESLAAIATRLPLDQLPESRYSRITLVIDWLKNPENSSWLLIFDNVNQDYRDMGTWFANGSYDVRRYFPAAGHGSILITTRLANLGRLGTSLRVGKVDRSQALAIFQNGCGREIEESEEVDVLLNLFDGFPMALAQVSAFIQESGSPLADCIQLYKHQWKKLMGIENFLKRSAFVYQYGSVTSRLRTSFTAVQQKHEGAANLLHLLSCLDNNDLWYELFLPAHLVLCSSMEFVPWFYSVVSSREAFENAMKVLLSQSLIDYSPTSDSFSVHRVVHEWAWQKQNPTTQTKSHWLAAVVVGSAVHDNFKQQDKVMQERLLPHADQYQQRGSDLLYSMSFKESSLGAINLESYNLKILGDFFLKRKRHEEAEKMTMRALKGYKWIGEMFEPALSTLHNLGCHYLRVKKLEKAEEMFSMALEEKEKLLGLEPDYEIYDLSSLQEICERALEGIRKAVKPEHITLLELIYDLGVLYREHGDLDTAKELITRALEGMSKAEEICTSTFEEKKRTFEPDHKLIVDTIYYLGLFNTKQGDLDKAEILLSRALEWNETAFGRENISTLSSAYNLGNVYFKQGRLEEAERMYMRTLDGKEAFEQESMFEFDIYQSLGNLYNDQGKIKEAEKAYVQALEGYEEVCGQENVANQVPALDTAWSLGSLYGLKKEEDQARAMVSRALAGYRKVLGETHWKTQKAQEKIDELVSLEKETAASHAPVENVTNAQPQPELSPDVPRTQSTSKWRKFSRKVGLK